MELLFALDVAFVAAYLTHFALGEPSPTWKAILDVNGEWNPPTFYSAAQLFVLAVGLWAFARAEPAAGAGERLALLLLPGLALFLALDEVAQIHESLGMLSDRLLPGGTREGTAFRRTGIWALLLGPPLLAVLGWVGWRMRARLAAVPRARTLFAAGLAVYLASVLGLELASNVARSWPARVFQHAAEELGEMVGATLLVWATHELLRARGLRWPRPRLPGAPHGTRARGG